MRSCACGPAVRNSEGATADDESSCRHPKRGQRLRRGRACNPARREEFAPVSEVHPHQASIRLFRPDVCHLRHCRQDWSCSGSAFASTNVQPDQMPLGCFRINIFGDNICGIVEAVNFCNGNVRASPRLILEPQVSDVEVADLPQALAAQNAYGCTGIGVHRGLEFHTEDRQQ